MNEILADTDPLVAYLVRMAERHEKSKVMTFDADFVVYRKSRRKVIPLLRPER